MWPEASHLISLCLCFDLQGISIFLNRLYVDEVSQQSYCLNRANTEKHYLQQKELEAEIQQL